MELSNKLAEIQQNLEVPKGQYNSFGKYNYRSCEDILTAVKPLLGDFFMKLSDEVVVIGDRFYVKATASINKGGNKIECVGLAREALNKKGMDEAQITGAASSYARKRALDGLFCIDDSKDADTDEQKNQVDNTPNWFNDFDKLKDQMSAKIRSGEQNAQGIIDSLKKNGFTLSNKTQKQIKGLK